MPLSRDLREFIECLNSNEVEYWIVGALAVSWHGFARYPMDGRDARVIRQCSAPKATKFRFTV
jgi:hypothetical protein